MTQSFFTEKTDFSVFTDLVIEMFLGNISPVLPVKACRVQGDGVFEQ